MNVFILHAYLYPPATKHSDPDPGPFHSVTPPIYTYVFTTNILTSTQTLVSPPRNLQTFLLSNHVMSAACMKQVVLFVICFVFSLCHIGNNGENHSWQLFYSFLMFFVCFVFKVQLRYLYFCNIKCVVFFFHYCCDASG